jgi:KaiC/GvpD/RAD55 family RecA-like ATPase
MLHGGLVPRRPYLVVGPSGTGKTTLGIQFLCEGVRRGEETLIVTLEEPPNEMRFNHRNLQPDLDRVWVFDAIPDVMRYERAPFKDVAQVRDAVRFADVTEEIRKTPELTSVEITLTSLEQTLKMQRARRHYTRLVIDSLTALQYFCMKGIDEVQGAQSFLRFLSDLNITTLLTVESPLEDVESPERMLARGEMRLFRWDLEGRTVRAIGVEKFRGSSHDIRLHPYRIGRIGFDINLEETISRDTRQVLRATVPVIDEHVAPILVTVGEPHRPPAPAVDPAVAVLQGISQEIADLKAAQLDLGAIRASLNAARGSLLAGKTAPAHGALVEVRALVHQMTLGRWSAHPPSSKPPGATRAAPAEPPEIPTTPFGDEELRHIIEALNSAVGEVPPPAEVARRAATSEPPAPPGAFDLPPAPLSSPGSPPISWEPPAPTSNPISVPTTAPPSAAAPTAPPQTPAKVPDAPVTAPERIPEPAVAPPVSGPAEIPAPAPGPASVAIPASGPAPTPPPTEVSHSASTAIVSSSPSPEKPAERAAPAYAGAPTEFAFGPTFESLLPGLPPPERPSDGSDRRIPEPSASANAVSIPAASGPLPAQETAPSAPTITTAAPSAVSGPPTPEVAPPRRKKRATTGTRRHSRADALPGPTTPPAEGALAAPASEAQAPGVPGDPTANVGTTPTKRRAPRRKKNAGTETAAPTPSDSVPTTATPAAPPPSADPNPSGASTPSAPPSEGSG